MARNPAIDPPRFVPPAQIYSSASPSPSPSRSSSPTRHSRNFSHAYDPLGRDLSPTRTLRAFTSAPGSADNKSEVALVRLIEKASTSERAFGIRIAQTCKDIKTWHSELQQWPWTDSFEPPANAADAVEGPYWGSLRENQVVAYEQRIQDIREALFDQDVDGLKDYVLSQHVQPKSSDYEHLGDFTALITATILRALPDLSRLDRLLNTWTIRVTLLRKIPGYLKGLEQAKADLDKAWSEMASHLRGTRDAADLRRDFQIFQEQLESRMGKVGGRLDSMLDDLEGREETLPDSWIDSFETLEATYSDWLIQTERHIVGLNMSPQIPSSEKFAPTGVTTREIISATAESSDQEDLAFTHAAPEVVDGTKGKAGDRHQPIESPILGTNSAAFLPDVDEASDLESDTVSKDLKKVPASPDGSTQAIAPNNSLRRAGSLKSLSPSVSRSRHVPIFVNYDEEMPTASSSVAPTPVLESPSLSTDQPSPTVPDEAPAAMSKVRARAAFLNGGIERTQSLQKSVNSPVRPFEHASMAFTKLFNKTNNAANTNGSSNSTHSRTSSISSRSSGRKGLGLGIKSHEGFRHFHRSSSLTTPNKPGKENEKSPGMESPQPAQSSPPPTTQSFSPDLENATRSVSQPMPDNQHKEIDRPMDAYVTPEIQQDYFPSTQDSKSTIDTNWDSPALAEFPENWPLPVKILGEEISTPRDPMDSDMFERMFVDSLPGTPQTKSRPQSQESNPFEKTFKSKRSKEPLLDDMMLNGARRHRSHSGSSSSGGSRPRHVSRPSTTSLSFEPISELPTPGSFDATPEVQDASAAGYFRAKQVQTPPGHRQSPGARSNMSRTNHSPAVVELEDANDASDERDGRSTFEHRPMIKRASVTSIENHSRSELNTIEIPDLPRRSSISSSPSSKPVLGSSPEFLHGRVSSHTRTGSAPAAPGSPPPTLRTDTERSLAANVLGASKPPPLNLEVHKRRYVVEPEATPRVSGPLQLDTTKKKHMRKESGAEQLDRHISRVLNTLPSRIAFKPSVANSTLDPSSASVTSSGPVRPRPALSNKSSRTGLTLSAVQPDSSSKKSSASDADGKMYHLTQEGKEQPIKLFVRLVGEGERCMVRVGGGWADLGEYLRQYAEHHGHRTFSDGKLEVAAAAANGGSLRVGGGTKARTPLSRPGSVIDRPDSSMSFRSRSSFGAVGASMPIDINSSPSSSSQSNELTPTHTRQGAYNTPTGSVKSSSRPSTADTFLHASPSSWSGQDIGLAGPSSKPRGGLDEQKARWVEEMIGRAKQASAEKKKTEADRAAWGDMGKVGGTRRMVFKNKHSGDNGSG